MKEAIPEDVLEDVLERFWLHIQTNAYIEARCSACGVERREQIDERKIEGYEEHIWGLHCEMARELIADGWWVVKAGVCCPECAEKVTEGET